MTIRQVQMVWKPKWEKFQPPKWFIFRWAYKIDVNAQFTMVMKLFVKQLFNSAMLKIRTVELILQIF